MNKSLYISILVLVLASLSCASPAIIVNTPAATTQAARSTETAEPTATRQPVSIIGFAGDCWNIRSGDGYSYQASNEYVCGGQSVTILKIGRNGYLRIDKGWICNQAIGGSEECK